MACGVSVMLDHMVVGAVWLSGVCAGAGSSPNVSCLDVGAGGFSVCVPLRALGDV